MQPLVLAPETDIPGRTATTGINNEAAIGVHIKSTTNGIQNTNSVDNEKPPSIQLNSGAKSDTAANDDPVVMASSMPDEGANQRKERAPPHKEQSLPIKVFSINDVSMHNTPNDIWLVIDNDIYDVTRFQHEHPGGAKSKSRPFQKLQVLYLTNVHPVMSGVSGKDATKRFDKYHRRALLDQYKPSLRVGILDTPRATMNPRRSLLQKLGIVRNKG